MSITRRRAGSVKLDIGDLRHLQEEVKKHGRDQVHVGVFNKANARIDKGPGNADILAEHEFGVISKNLPERSVLRAPLINFLPAAMKAVGTEKWKKLVEKNGIVEALKKIGVLCEAVVQEGFDTGGYGEWPALSPRRVKEKNGDRTILIDTAQLRQAITSRVVHRA